MSYVYGKVANDKNSSQTPHYGYFDGDGDFIFKAPELDSSELPTEKDIDRLITIPFSEEIESSETTTSKVQRVKTLLANDSSSIELHDFIIEEVRRYLGATDEDNFSMQGSFSATELIERVSRYEELSNDLATLFACVAYWAKPSHTSMLQKAFARLTDRIESQGGLKIWLSFRWYPIILGFYCAGIAAIDGKRYDVLASIFYTKTTSPDNQYQTSLFIENISNAIASLVESSGFKQLPGHERHYAPMSEYLFKAIQPKLDDVLFVGKNYERSFDEFETLVALVCIDLSCQSERYLWGPIGRFGWKHGRGHNSPLTALINEAKLQTVNWAPVRAGLFGGDIERFYAAAEELQQTLSKQGWR